jgi:O-antigen ligase
MNYEISQHCLSEIATEKLDSRPFLLLILSIIFIPAAYVFVAAVFIVEAIRGNLNIKKNISTLLIYAYFTIGVISSEYKLISVFFALLMMLCYYSYNLFKSLDKDSLSKVRKIIYAVSILVFIIGIMQYLNTDFEIPTKWVDSNEYKLNKRIYSTFFNPNVFGFYINFIILLAIENLNFKKINLESVVFLSCIICLILTFSRTAWISLVIALIVVSIFNRKYLKYALIISLAIFSFDTLLGIGRIDPVKAAEDSSFLYRFEVWKTSFEIIKDNLISGIGFGTLFKHVADYSSIVSSKIEHSHNIYIQIFTETGIMGFSIFLIILFKVLKTFKRRLLDKNNNQWITAFAVFVMTLIHGLVDSVALTPQILLILSIYAGTISALNSEQLTMK